MTILREQYIIRVTVERDDETHTIPEVFVDLLDTAFGVQVSEMWNSASPITGFETAHDRMAGSYVISQPPKAAEIRERGARSHG